MRQHYDSTGARRNPYASRLAVRTTIRVDPNTLAYLEKSAGECETSRARIASLLLRECARAGTLPIPIARDAALRKTPISRASGRQHDGRKRPR